MKTVRTIKEVTLLDQIKEQTVIRKELHVEDMVRWVILREWQWRVQVGRMDQELQDRHTSQYCREEEFQIR